MELERQRQRETGRESEDRSGGEGMEKQWFTLQ